MKLRLIHAAVGVGLLVGWVANSPADPLAYNLKPGTNLVYEVTITAELPEQTKTEVGYLLYKPQSVDGNGQTRLAYNYQVASTTTTPTNGGGSQKWGGSPPGFLSKSAMDKPDGFSLTIDRQGNVVRDDSGANPPQLGAAIGMAGELMLQPLPSGNQMTWSTHRKISLYYDKQEGPRPGWGAPPWARQRTTRIETPAQEDVTYASAGPVNGITFIQRKYDVASLEKTGDTPTEEIVGSGHYAFNPQIGALEAAEYKFSSNFNNRNVQVKIPLTVTIKLLSAEELSNIQDQIAQDQKKSDEMRQRMAEDAKNHPSSIPDGMTKTDLFGHVEGGGPYITINPDHKPVIGFRITYGDWGGKKSIRDFDPLYEKPKTTNPDDTIVLARDGYAVGSVTITGEDSVDSLYIKFMKKVDNGLDVKTNYNSTWYGTNLGKPRKTLTGNGKFILGTFGRKGLNMDAIGLVIEGDSAQDQPAKDEPAKDAPAKDEPAKDEPAK